MSEILGKNKNLIDRMQCRTLSRSGLPDIDEFMKQFDYSNVAASIHPFPKGLAITFALQQKKGQKDYLFEHSCLPILKRHIHSILITAGYNSALRSHLLIDDNFTISFVLKDGSSIVIELPDLDPNEC